jgi:hypothetical protein
MLQYAPRRLQEAPILSNMPPRRLQDAPRCLQDASKTLQDVPKMPPRCFLDAKGALLWGSAEKFPVRFVFWLWLGCGARLLVISACDSGAVCFSVATGTLWGVCGKVPLPPLFASKFGGGSGAGPCSTSHAWYQLRTSSPSAYQRSTQ